MERVRRCLKAVFEPAAFEPFSRTPDAEAFERLWASCPDAVLAHLSHASYHGAGTVESLMQRLGAVETHSFSFGSRAHDARRADAPAHALLAAWPDKVILVFRGSACGHDTLTDLWFLRRRFGTARVHAGFAQRFGQLWPEIEPVIEGISADTPILATGHSLGGAMACLAGTRFRFEEIVTFGEPRVGLGLETIFRAGAHRRVVNGRDPVCRIPLPIGYRHHGDATVLVDPDHGTSARYDHAIVYYAEILELLADQRVVERSRALAA
jgi:hypothetical protein